MAVLDEDIDELAEYQIQMLQGLVTELEKEKRNAMTAVRNSEKQKRKMSIHSFFKTNKPTENLKQIPSGIMLITFAFHVS